MHRLSAARARAFIYARLNNMSFAFNDAPAGLKKAILVDRDLNNRVYVAAAGDTGTEKDMYPAFWSDRVIGVTGVYGGGAGEPSNDAWAGSRGNGSTYYCGGGQNSTPQKYQVSAYYHAFTTDTQGNLGYSTGSGSPATADYTHFNGTSASSAYVSAAAALIYSRAQKKGRLDNESNDVTPTEVT
jgi:hypothetical protein